MLTTIIYILGTLSLQFSDTQSQGAFFNLFLPLVNLFFFMFIVWQLIFFFSFNTFSHEDSPFSQLLQQYWNLNYDIREYGFFQVMVKFSIHLINTACFLLAAYYYLLIFLDFI